MKLWPAVTVLFHRTRTDHF